MADSRPILNTLGIGADVIERRPDDAHLSEVKRVIEPLIDDSAHFILSGKAQSIQVINRGLKERSITPRRLRMKAYWALGKNGLD